MTLLDGDWLSGPLSQRLTWTLLHFCWQGIAVAALVAVCLRLFRPVLAETRYAMCLVGLTLMVAVPAATFLAIPLPPPRVAALPVEVPANVAPVGLPVDDLPTDEPASQMTILDDPSARTVEMPAGPKPIEDPTLAEQFAGLLRDGQPYLLVAWTLGVFLLGSRLLVGYAGVQLLRRRREPLSEALAGRIAELGRRMGLAGCPQVFASQMARAAMAVGFFRPVVLVPAAWLLEMSPEALEAVIAHELAHLRRWDLWVNLVQRLAETLFFYHPAVWWLSRRIRLEREMCCDAAAVEATGQRVDYLRALEWVARQRASSSRLLLDASIGGRTPMLVNRVRYLIGLDARCDKARWWPVGLMAVVLAAGIWISIGAGAMSEAVESDPSEEASTVACEGVLTPAHRSYVCAKIDGTVRRIHVAHCEEVKKGDLLLEMDNHDVVLQMLEKRKELESVRERLQSSRFKIKNRKYRNDEEREQLAGQVSQLGAAEKNLTLQVAIMEQKGKKLQVRSPLTGQVIMWNTRDLSDNRPVRAGQQLMEVADTEGPWRVELIVSEERARKMIRAQKESGQDLPVTFISAIEPGVKHKGRIRAIEVAATSPGKQGNAVLIQVDIDDPIDRDKLRVGVKVRAKVDLAPPKLGEKPAAVEPRMTVSLADLIEKVRENEKLYRDIDVSMTNRYDTGDQEVSASDGFNPIVTGETRIHYISRSGMFRLERTRAGAYADGTTRTSNRIRAFDGKRTLLYDQDAVGNTIAGRSEDIYFVAPHGLLLRHNQWMSPLSVWLEGHDAIRKYYRNDLEDKLDVDVAYEGTDTFDGLRCHKVSITVIFRELNDRRGTRRELWLAEDRNYIPVHVITSDPRESDKLPCGVGTVNSWREVKRGVWFPTAASYTRYDPFVLRREGKQNLQWRHDYLVSHVSLDPTQNQSAFRDVAFPDGTAMYEIEDGKIVRSYRKGSPEDPEAAAAKPVDVTVEQIRAAWEKRQKNVRSFQFVCEMTQTRMKGSSNYLREQPNTRYYGTTEDIPPEDVTVRRTITFSRSGERLAFAEEGKPWDIGLNGPVDGGHFECFDGKLLKWYSTTGGRLLGKIREGIGDSFVAYYFGVIPIWYAVSPIDRLTYDNDQFGAIAVQGRAIHDGRECVKLSIPGQATSHSTLMVVDPSRSFLPVEIVSKYNDEVRTHLTIDYAPDKQLDWSISGWEAAHFGDKPGQVATTQRGKVLRYSINKPLDKTIFQFDFPPGTEVTDFTGSQRRDFVVPEKRPASPQASPSR